MKTNQERFEALRDKIRQAEEEINRLCPDSKDKQQAFKYLDTALMWATASIVRSKGA